MTEPSAVTTTANIRALSTDSIASDEPTRPLEQESTGKAASETASDLAAAIAASPRTTNLCLDDLHDRETSTLKGDDTLRVEAKLQQNLKKQQENYARQRKLLEDLRRGEHPKPSRSLDLSSVSSASTCSNLVRQATRSDAKQQPLSRAFSPPTTPPPAKTSNDWKCSDSSSPPAVRRGTTPSTTRTHHSKAAGLPTGRASNFYEEFQQQEASNDALRKQLELLRRLQLENNRFRHENRSLREEKELFEQQNQLLQNEKVRAHEEIIVLTQKLQQQQVKLAASSQTTKKLKLCTKQVHQLQQANAKLESALEDTHAKQHEIHDKVDQELQALLGENKKLKRSLRHEKQLGKQCQEDTVALRSTIDNLQSQMLELDQQMADLRAQKASLELEVRQKAKQCETIENTASDCVQRIEGSLANAQKAYAGERDKRKKLEKVVEKLQLQLDDTMQRKDTLQQRLENLNKELEAFSSETQARIEALTTQKDQSEAQLARLREQNDDSNALIAQLRQQMDQKDQTKQQLEHQMACSRMELSQETKKLRREVDHLRNYLEQSFKPQQSQQQSSTGALGEATGSLSSPIPLPPVEEDNAQTTSMMHLIAQSHEENWLKSAELQYLQATLASLRNEVLNFVNEFHRCRHVVRTQSQRLTLTSERVAELEHLRTQDALRFKELTEKQQIAEQARDISSKEKLEVLRWSQETCDKNESLQQQVAKCGEFLRKWLNELQLRACDDDPQLLRAIDWHEKMPVPASGTASSAAATAAAAAAVVAGKTCSASCIDPLPWLAPLEQQIQYLVATRTRLFECLQHQLQEQQDQKRVVSHLQHEMQMKLQEKDRLMHEIEQLHQQTMHEHKQLYERSLQEAEKDKAALVESLQQHQTSHTTLQQETHQLEQVLQQQQQDLASLASILHVLVLVLRPFLMQVSDLLGQKRLLVRENADLLENQREMQCLGQVLKELVPLPSNGEPSARTTTKETTVTGDSQLELEMTLEQIELAGYLRKHKFRKVLIVVFAANRFRRVLCNAKWTGVCESVLPFCPVTQSSTRPRIDVAGVGAGDPVVIKVLPAKPTLSQLNLRELLARFKQLELPQKLAQIVDKTSSSSSSTTASSTSATATAVAGASAAGAAQTCTTKHGNSGIGTLLLQLVSIFDETHSSSTVMTQLLMDNLVGVFHCQALVRRQSTSKRASKACAASSLVHSNFGSVDFIRKRILALGKRLEDLQYQRNALQQDNYELQFQLEQQRVHLQEMEVLTKTTNDFKSELEQLHCKQQQDQAKAQDQVTQLSLQIDQNLQQIQQLQRDKDHLTNQLHDLQGQRECEQSEKEEMHQKLRDSTHKIQEESHNVALLKMSLAKNQVEITNLKQAARQAHELVQKTSRQLEREIDEKAALQTQLQQLARQKDQWQQSMQQEQRRELETSLQEVNQSFDASQSSASISASPSVPPSASCNGSFSSSTGGNGGFLRQQQQPQQQQPQQVASAMQTPPHRHSMPMTPSMSQSRSLPVTPARSSTLPSAASTPVAGNTIAPPTASPSVTFATPPPTSSSGPYIRPAKAPAQVQSPAHSQSEDRQGFNFVQVKKADEVTKRVNELLRELQKENPRQSHRVSVRNAYDDDQVNEIDDDYEQVHDDYNDDDEEEEEQEATVEDAQQCHVSARGRSQVHSTTRAWRQDSSSSSSSANALRPASVLNDVATGSSPLRSQSFTSRALEIASNRHKIDVDKVNSAVHDYMDRIDEKLHKMYGIPHSNRWQQQQQKPTSKNHDLASLEGESEEELCVDQSLRV